MRTALATSRLRLTAFGPADAAELHELFSDPSSFSIGSGPFTALAQTTRWIDNRVRAQREHGLCWYAVRSGGTGRLIGNCGMLKGRTGHAEPELGYLISRPWRGQGFAYEAAAAVLRECRAAGLTRVWASIRPANAASLRIAGKLGMRPVRMEHDDRGELLFHVVGLSRPAVPALGRTRCGHSRVTPSGPSA